MSQDPLTAFVSRSLRADVADVRSELVAKNALMEIERIRFSQEGVERSLALKRVPPDDSLEVQLLPFLARKTDRVPRVLSRGVPPAAVPAWPWVMKMIRIFSAAVAGASDCASTCDCFSTRSDTS